MRLKYNINPTTSFNGRKRVDIVMSLRLDRRIQVSPVFFSWLEYFVKTK